MMRFELIVNPNVNKEVLYLLLNNKHETFIKFAIEIDKSDGQKNQLVKAFNWSFLDLQRVTINALKSAFIPFEERLAIIDEIVKPGFAKISAE